MVQLIVGNKGKGKTKYLLDSVNDAVANANGNIVYIDKSLKHMHELDKKIRLVDVSPYPVVGHDQLDGFICGVLSQDYDIEKIYIDSFTYIADIKDVKADLNAAVEQLEKISAMNKVDFVISVSSDKSEISEDLWEKIIIAL